jgi:hypothetical protein
MNTLRSSQFKTQYPHLTEPTEVTVNGHLIGTWTPHTEPLYVLTMPPATPESVATAITAARAAIESGIIPDNLRPAAPDPVRTARAAQKQRDDWLRKSNKP